MVDYNRARASIHESTSGTNLENCILKRVLRNIIEVHESTVILYSQKLYGG